MTYPIMNTVATEEIPAVFKYRSFVRPYKNDYYDALLVNNGIVYVDVKTISLINVAVKNYNTAPREVSWRLS